MLIKERAESRKQKAERIKTAKSFSLLCVFCFKLSALSLLLPFACSKKPESGHKENSTKFQQYYIQGEQLYVKHCSNCHQKNGTGLGLLFPPLNHSDFVDAHFEKVICVMKNGIKGELIVNGKSFNKEMPAIPSLTDLEVAEIATFIYNSWEREKGIIEVTEVSRVLSLCDSVLVNR